MRIQFSEQADKELSAKLPFQSILADDFALSSLAFSDAVHTFPLQMPDEFHFLHESAVIEFHGTIFTSWYNNYKDELIGFTPIRGKRSADGGRTWTPVEMIAEDPAKKLLYCPPVYGISDDTLYMLMNTMVSADHIHSLEFYRYDENDLQFHLLRSDPMPFKLNTNVVTLPNGKLMLPGRIGELDGFPNTPAVLICDSGKVDGRWRLVRIQENGKMPDGSELIYPELSAVVIDKTVWIFCRDDQREVPLLYRSDDLGEHWIGPLEHDIPFTNSKIYSGTLSDGRNYVIGNILSGRTKLAIFFSKPGTLEFHSGIMLRDGIDKKLNLHPQWSYPFAHEANGKLYVIYTMQTEEGDRGAMMSIIDLKCV